MIMLHLLFENPQIHTMVEGMFMLCSVLFILTLGGLSNAESSRKGNFYGMVAMALAIASTTFLDSFRNSYFLFTLIFAIGGVIGLTMAIRVEMVHMPDMVAILHSFVGFAATAVGFASYYAD